MLLAYLRPHLRHTVTRALYQKEHYLTDHPDVIFEVQKCSESKFSGAPHQQELTGRAYIVPHTS